MRANDTNERPIGIEIRAHHRTGWVIIFWKYPVVVIARVSTRSRTHTHTHTHSHTNRTRTSQPIYVRTCTCACATATRTRIRTHTRTRDHGHASVRAHAHIIRTRMFNQARRSAAAFCCFKSKILFALMIIMVHRSYACTFFFDLYKGVHIYNIAH